jgi:hypothetical protein
MKLLLAIAVENRIMVSRKRPVQQKPDLKIEKAAIALRAMRLFNS